MSKKWQKRRFNLSDKHRWKAKPGNKIFVINRGAVHFEHPGRLGCQARRRRIYILVRRSGAG